MDIDKSHEPIRIACIPTERDWLVRLRTGGHGQSGVSFGPASLDRTLLQQAEIVLFDATAPASLLDWLAGLDVIAIQLADIGDPVYAMAYFYLPQTIEFDALCGHVLTAYRSRFHPKRVVGLVGAVGGCGLSEVAITLAWQWAQDGLPTLLVDAGSLPGDLSVRLGLANISSDAVHEVQRVDDATMLWLSFLGAGQIDQGGLTQALPHIDLRRVVVDMGTAIHPSVIARLDDLIVVTRPTPGGIQRCARLAEHYPELTIAVNGEPVGPGVIALHVLTRSLPGQVHRLPAVADVQMASWAGRCLDDPTWLDAIGRLLPPHATMQPSAA